jgi:hypothetical protein
MPIANPTHCPRRSAGKPVKTKSKWPQKNTVASVARLPYRSDIKNEKSSVGGGAMAYHLQVKRKDGSVVMAYVTSQRHTPKMKQRVECPQRKGLPVRARVSVILPNALLSDDGRIIDLVEADEV